MARVLFRDNCRLRSPLLSPHPALSPPIFPSSSPCSSYTLLPQQDDGRVGLSQQLLSLLKQCQSLTHLNQIHARLITSGRIKNPFFASKLLNLSAEFEDLHYTLLVFQSINFPDTVCVNTVIKAYSTSSVPQQGVIFYFEMLNSGFYPNSFTFPPLLSCCAKKGWSMSGGICHGHAIKSGVDSVLQVQNSLIHMYACCGLIEIALSVFDEMRDRDIVTWNSMVDGYAKAGDINVAHKLFDVMPERNLVSWNVMISGYLEVNNPGVVLKLFREMMKARLVGNEKTVVGIVTACGRSARLKEGMSVHGHLLRTRRDMNLITNTAMVDMYSRCRKLEVARRIFDSILGRNLVCWNVMILGHCIHGKPEDGLDLFERMIGRAKFDDVDASPDRDEFLDGEQIVLPDEITFVGVLCACTRAGLLTEGNGLVQEAMETIREVADYNTSASSETLLWASLLGSCRLLGDVSLGEQVAKSLVQLEPENIMCYALLLNIYAAAGRWEDVAQLKEMIKAKVDGRLPGSSLVDLIEIVHNFKAGERQGMLISTIMDELAQRKDLSTAHL
ncbi:hypothetical protein Ancab_026641 [Ancistrocladus abbreviatus]